MAKTVGTLAYMITADTRQFTDGVVRTRKETAALKGVLEATATPAQKYADALAGLNQLRGKGLDDASYAKAVGQLNKEFSVSAAQVPKATSALAAFNPALAGVAVASAGAALGLKLVKDAASFVAAEVTEAYERLDTMAQSADKLGVSLAVFQDLTFAAELADVGISEVTKSMDQMLVSISKGNTGKFAKAFGDLRVDVAKLREMRPEQMFRELLNALEGVRNQADKTRLAKTIFGDTNVLRLHVDSLDEANRLLEKMGVHMSALDEQNLSKMDAEWTKMNLLVDALAERVAADLAPTFTEFARELNGLLIDSADLIRGITVMVGGLSDQFGDAAAAFKELFVNGELGAWIMDLVAAMKALGMLKRFENQVREMRTPAKSVLPGIDPSLANSVAMGMFGMGAGGQGQLFFDSEIDKSIEKMEEQLLALQISSDSFAIYKASVGGATQAQIDHIDALQQQITAQKKLNDLQKDAEKAVEGLKTPYQQARDEIAQYAEMLERGFIAMDQFNALRDKSASKFRQSQKNEDFRNPAALSGSQQAIQLIANARFGNNNVWERMAKTLENIEGKIGEDRLNVPVIENFGRG